VQIVGRSILIYKRHPQHPRYEGRKAKEKAEAATPSPSSKRRPGSRAPRTPGRRTS
jgi:hypothetical protein